MKTQETSHFVGRFVFFCIHHPYPPFFGLPESCPHPNLPRFRSRFSSRVSLSALGGTKSVHGDPHIGTIVSASQNWLLCLFCYRIINHQPRGVSNTWSNYMGFMGVRLSRHDWGIRQMGEEIWDQFLSFWFILLEGSCMFLYTNSRGPNEHDKLNAIHLQI